MKYICQYVEGFGREKYLNEMIKQIPDLIVIPDTVKGFMPEKNMKSAMFVFLQSMIFSGGEPFIHLEDDVILCEDFKNKVLGEIEKHPDSLIQFYTNRATDYKLGSRFVTGSKFAWNQCTYYPKNMGLEIAKSYPDWVEQNNNRLKHPTGLDTIVADYMKKHKLKYWVVIPCFVQHAEGVSAINPKRARDRSSKYFIDDMGVRDGNE